MSSRLAWLHGMTLSQKKKGKKKREKKKRKGCKYSSVAECLLSSYEALGLIPSITDKT
jgi:hypothetical protein